MAEDDDDDGFGDFTFASFNPSSNSPQQTHQTINCPISAIKGDGDGDGDEEEWGDFVETPPGSFASSNNTTPSKSSVDPFDFFSQNRNPTPQFRQSGSGDSTRGREEKKNDQNPDRNENHWVKLKGAIPLSIFGDVEEEEEGKEEAVGGSGASDPHLSNGKGFSIHQKVDSVSDGFKSNGYLGASFSFDAFASFDNRQTSLKNNGTGLNANVMKLDANGGDSSKKDSILELSGFDSDAVSAHKRSDSDSVMSLSNQIQQRKVEDGVNVSSNGMSSNLDALNLDFSGGWNHDFNSFSAKSSLNFGVPTNLNDRTGQKENEISTFQFNFNGFNFDTKYENNSHFGGLDSNSVVVESSSVPASINVDMHSNLNGRNEELDGSEDDDDDGWEFQDANAQSNVREGNEEARYKMETTLKNNATSELWNDTNRVTNLFTVSNGFSDSISTPNGKTNRFDIGMDVRSSTLNDNHVASDVRSRDDLIGSEAINYPHPITEIAESDDVFGEFSAAYTETGEMLEANSKVHESFKSNASSSGINGSNESFDFSRSNRAVDLFVPSIGKRADSNEVNAGFEMNPSAASNDEAADSSYKFDASLRSEQIDGNSVWDPNLVIQSAEPDENFGAFSAASVENSLGKEGELRSGHLSDGGNNQEREIKSDHNKGALPLSIFGDEEAEIDSSLNSADAFTLQPASFKGNGHDPNSIISISDIISNLYSQAEQISSANLLQNQVVNGLEPSDSASFSKLVNNSDGDDNSPWELRDSFCNSVADNGTSIYVNEDAHGRSSGNLKLQSYIDFYSKLKDDLYLIAKGHLANLKETQATSISFEDENVATLIAEIQEAYKELGTVNGTTKEDYLGKDNNLNHFLEVLQDPRFHILQTEYNLEMRFSQVERDFNSVIELIEHAKTMLKILMLGSSDEQLSYISTWSKMISACAQELQHGALIWRHSLQKNICSHILAEPQGKAFVLALGEIFRAALLLGAAVKLYKPWILSSHVDSSRLFALLDDCRSSWSSSGLEGALTSILDPSLEGSSSLPLIVDSMKYIYNLDLQTLHKHVFVPLEPICRLSLLTPWVAKGMEMVAWDEEHCFLKLANLWANLVSSDLPDLPPIQVNG